MLLKKQFTLGIKAKVSLLHSNRGHSIVEIISVLGIVSIILSMSLPVYHASNRAYMKGLGRQLCADIRLVRTRAMAGESGIKIKLYEDHYTVLDRSNEIKSVRLNQTLKLETYLNHAKNEISFSDSGSPSFSGAIHVVSGSGQFLELTLVPSSGRVLLKEEFQ